MDSYTFPSLESSSSSTVNITSTPMDQSTSLRIPRSRSNSTSTANRPSLPSRSSSSSAFDDSKRRKRSSTLFSSSTGEGVMSSLPSSSTIRSSQHSNSTFDPLDSQIVYASMSNLRGQSTPAVVVALPNSASPKSLVFPGRKSSLGPARAPTIIPTRRTSFPPSPYFRPSNSQASAAPSIKEGEVYTAPMASSSSMKKLPRSSSSRRSLSSLIGSMFSSSASSTSLASAARNPEGFASDSWEHAVAVGVIEAGQARPGRDASSIFGRRVSRRNKALPALRVEEEVDPLARAVRGSIAESYYHPSAGYFEAEGDETETEATRRRSSTKTSGSWELDVDLGGQGLGIAHLFDDDNLQTTYDVFSAPLPLPSTLTTIDEDRSPVRQRGQTHSTTDSSSTGFSSLPPVTPRLRSSSPTIALPRPKATFFPAPIDIDLLPPHLPDIPPTSPLDVALFPIATPPKDALLDLSPRRRSLRPPGIAAPVVMHQDQDLPVEVVPFAKAEQFFNLGGDGNGENERQRKLRARVSSCGTFGGKRRSVGVATGGTEVDLGSESELEELVSDDGSSIYSQESTIQPLNVKARPVSVPVSTTTATTTNESVPSSSSPHAPSFMTLGPAVSRGSASSFGSNSPPPSPSRPPRNPARDAVALATKPNLW